MPLEPRPDLHWTAFLYVAGDLAPEEASSFEARLADDQDARDAVLEAVELAEALAVVGRESRPRRRSIGRRALIGVSVLAAAACLVLAVGPGLRPIRPARPDPSEVALAWSSLRGDADAEWLAVPHGATTTGSVEADAGVESVPGVEVEAEVEPSTDRALPSWLLSAASASLDNANGRED